LPDYFSGGSFYFPFETEKKNFRAGFVEVLMFERK